MPPPPSRARLRAHPLQTERLRLVPADLTDGHELWRAVDGSREHLERWLPWARFCTSRAGGEQLAAGCAAEWDQGRGFRFAIRDAREGAFMGLVGLEACVHLHHSCELGFWLRHEAQGRGLMVEAARAVIGFGFQQLGMHRIRAAAATDNHRSLRVLARLGFQHEGVARHAEWCDGRWLDHAVFGLLATDPR